jgi:alkyl-hydroperoxide reductase/thiol specific antioxidant family protein
LRDREPEFVAAGARLAAVGLGDRTYAQAFREESAIRFPLLVDERREAYRAAGLGMASMLDVAKPSNLLGGLRAFSAGHRVGRIGQDPMQLGGSFVFGPGNVDRFAHVSETFSDNAPVETLLAALRA